MTKKGGGCMGYDIDGTRDTTEWWQFVRDAARLIRAIEAGGTAGDRSADDLVRVAGHPDRGRA